MKGIFSYKQLILALSMILSGLSYGQYNSDSLQLAISNLDKALMNDIQQYRTSNSDFLVIRVNDPLSDDNNSYNCYFNKDSCTSGFSISIDPEREMNGSRYGLRYGHMSFAYANEVYSPGDTVTNCVNALTNEERLSEMKPVLKVTDTAVTLAGLTAQEYFIYGRIGNQFIFEQFNREMITNNQVGSLYQFVSQYIYIY